MPRQTLSCDTLGDLHHGFARSIIDAALAAAIRDLEDRGAEDEKPRKVVITVSLLKIGEDGVAATVEAAAKVPAYRIPATVADMRPGAKGPSVEFRSDSPGNPSQQTIDDALPEE